MAYHVGICEGSDIYGEHYQDARLVVIWESEDGAVRDFGPAAVVPGGTTMKIFGAARIETDSISKDVIDKASPDELLAMTDAAVDRAFQVARIRALRNVTIWKRWWLGRKFDSIWRAQAHQ